MQLQEWVVQLVKVFSDLVVGIAGIVATVIAIKGYGTWRRELVGKGKYDAARDVVKKAFAFRNEVNEARKITVVSHEWADREASPDEAPALAKVLNEQYATQQRLLKVKSIRFDLQASCWEAEVLFGESPETLFHPFNELYLQLAGSFQYYYEHKHSKALGLDGYDDEESRRRYRIARDSLYGIEDDEFGSRLNEEVLVLQRRVSKYMAG